MWPKAGRGNCVCVTLLATSVLSLKLDHPEYQRLLITWFTAAFLKVEYGSPPIRGICE